MEEILASIRRIISEEGEPADVPPAAPEPHSFRHVAEVSNDRAPNDVLELTGGEPPAKPSPDIVSETTAAVATQQLSQLSAMLVKGYEGSENTLEGMVRDMLRPLLKSWLDEHLPDIVEKMVAREISRITGRVE